MHCRELGPVIKVNVSARGLHGAFERQLNQYVSKISNEMLDEITDKAAEHMWELYGEADYAGQNPYDVITVDVEDKGPLSKEIVVGDDDTGIASFIEYGTGIYATKKINHKTNKRHWWFYDDERDQTHGPIDVVENGWVEHAKPKKRWYERVEIPIYGTNKTTRNILYGTKVDYKKLEKPVETEQDGVWFTRGNPANNIVTKTRDYILNEALPEVAAKTPGVRYTKW